MLQPIHKETTYQPRIHEERVLVRVNCRVSNGQVVEGFHIPFGEHELLAPVTTAQEILALVEDRPEALVAAEETYRRKMARWCEETGKPESKYGSSPAAEFYATQLRPVKPFISAEIVETGYEPEMTDEQRSIATVARQVSAPSKSAEPKRKGKSAA